MLKTMTPYSQPPSSIYQAGLRLGEKNFVALKNGEQMTTLLARWRLRPEGWRSLVFLSYSKNEEQVTP